MAWAGAGLWHGQELAYGMGRIWPMAREKAPYRRKGLFSLSGSGKDQPHTKRGCQGLSECLSSASQVGHLRKIKTSPTFPVCHTQIDVRDILVRGESRACSV